MVSVSNLSDAATFYPCCSSHKNSADAPVSILKYTRSIFHAKRIQITDHWCGSGVLDRCLYVRVHSGRGCCWWVSVCGRTATASSSALRWQASPGECRVGQACAARPCRSPPTPSCGTCSGSRPAVWRPSAGCTWRADRVLPATLWTTETFACRTHRTSRPWQAYTSVLFLVHYFRYKARGQSEERIPPSCTVSLTATSRCANPIYDLPKFNKLFSGSNSNFPKYHENPSITFWVILFTGTETKKQTAIETLVPLSWGGSNDCYRESCKFCIHPVEPSTRTPSSE